MSTKFTFKAFFPIVLLVAITYLNVIFIPTIFNNDYYDDKLFPKIFLPSILISTMLFLFGEVRTKFIIFELTKTEIVIKQFYGLRKIRIKKTDLEGWKYSHLTSKGGTYEYLYLYKDNEKIAKISEFYHQNYFKIKNTIQAEFKYLGYENFSMIDEFKELFK